MNQDLQQKVIRDLEESGFHSEMITIKAFLARGWECHGSFSYLDKDQQTSREGDFYAITGRTDLRKNVGMIKLWLRVVGEVKKSKNPWIVFKERPFRPADLLEAWNNLTYHLNLPCEPAYLADSLTATSLLHHLGWKAHGVHESFKKPSDSSRWYSAFVSACKGAEGAIDSVTSVIEPVKAALKDEIYMELIKPLVVLDGILLSAEISDTGEITLEEVDCAAFRFQYKSRAYTHDHYCLDLSTLKGLDKYLELSERRVATLYEALRKYDADPAAAAAEFLGSPGLSPR